LENGASGLLMWLAAAATATRVSTSKSPYLVPAQELEGVAGDVTATVQSRHDQHLTHRWIGIVTCLLFAMWFVSGLVMLYVPFPELKHGEWFAGQRPIAWSEVRAVPPPGSWALEMQGDVPVWRVTGADGTEAGDAIAARAGVPVLSNSCGSAIGLSPG